MADMPLVSISFQLWVVMLQLSLLSSIQFRLNFLQTILGQFQFLLVIQQLYVKP